MLMLLPGLGRSEVAEGLVLAQAAAVAEELDEVEYLRAGGGASGRMRVSNSSLSRAQKRSAAASSKRDPVRPQLCRGPNFNWPVPRAAKPPRGTRGAGTQHEGEEIPLLATLNV
ncbi:hypothetical protein ABZ684_03955 [Streptomyces sp. NPDC006995]|uniref:hypothetical protein n=1 Tax=Streptomyces sp. NPDC006995 TaxID=3156907 RepID=UPI0033E7B3A6